MSLKKPISIIFLATVCLFLIVLHTREVVAQNLRICSAGLENCERFISNKENYRNCIISECNQKKQNIRSYFELNEGEENLELIDTCDYGLRRCESLSNDKLAFWQCVKESCDNEPQTYDATCHKGQNQCVNSLRAYNGCMRFNCPKDEDGKVTQCSNGIKNCEPALRGFWRCVYGVCLGDVSSYRSNRIDRKYVRVKDLNGNITVIKIEKKPPVLLGAPDGKLNPPKGVNPEEWVREIPSRYLLLGSPSKSLRCYRPYERIKCYTNDIRSCVCSDGSIPIFLKGAPKPIYQEEWDE